MVRRPSDVRRVALACGLTAAFAAISSTAQARPIVEYPRDPSATPIAKAMAGDPTLVRRAVFSTVPPSSKPAAVVSERLAGFPRSGPSFGALTTGNARHADDPNDEPDKGSQSGGPSIRGARDVAIMKIFLRIPRGANCLSFNFRFLSEEFPEYVDDQFNDAFIAEVGNSTWTASTKEEPEIKAPRNFAVDSRGNPIRINRVGDATMSASRAKGTTYDGATRLLRASTLIKPGNRKLYLSIFDQGDRIFDSAVFVDNLRANRRTPCRAGVAVQR